MIHMWYRMVCKCRIQLWCNAGNVSWWSAGTPGVVECFVSAVERCERGWGLPEVVGVCLPVCVCVYESVSVGACVPVVYVYACRVLIVGAAPRCRWSNAGWQETWKDREREGGREVVREADKRKRERGEEAWCRRRGENRRRKDHEYRWEKRGKLGAFAGEFLTPGSFSDPIKCRSFLPPQSNFFPSPSHFCLSLSLASPHWDTGRWEEMTF